MLKAQRDFLTICSFYILFTIDLKHFPSEKQNCSLAFIKITYQHSRPCSLVMGETHCGKCFHKVAPVLISAESYSYLTGFVGDQLIVIMHILTIFNPLPTVTLKIVNILTMTSDTKISVKKLKFLI